MWSSRAQAPRLRAIPKVEQRSWTAEELQAFLRAAAGHRLFAALGGDLLVIGDDPHRLTTLGMIQGFCQHPDHRRRYLHRITILAARQHHDATPGKRVGRYRGLLRLR